LAKYFIPVFSFHDSILQTFNKWQFFHKVRKMTSNGLKAISYFSWALLVFLCNLMYNLTVFYILADEIKEKKARAGCGRSNNKE
jgi:hypothetical protein